MHDALGVGDTLKVDCTENRFELCEDAKLSVLIAGGIGITPLMAMVARLRRLNRSWELHYVARTRRDAAFIGALDAFSRSEEHTSELQSLMRISYAVFCLKKQKY